MSRQCRDNHEFCDCRHAIPPVSTENSDLRSIMGLKCAVKVLKIWLFLALILVQFRDFTPLKTKALIVSFNTSKNKLATDLKIQ